MRQLFFFLFTSLAFTTQGQNTTYVNPAIISSAFDRWSYWVYEEQATGDIDSVYVADDVLHTYFVASGGPGPGDESYIEYYRTKFSSEILPTQYEQRITSSGAYLVKDETTAHPYGQPVYYHSVSPGDTIAGSIWIAILDSMQVNNYWFYNVQHTFIREAYQWDQVYDYDTDIYFVNGIGIIRRQWTDTITGISHTYNLKRWNTSLAGIGNKLDKLSISTWPNPSSGEFTMQLPYEMLNEAVTIKFFDVSGRKITEKILHGKANILINAPDWDLISGLYFIEVSNRNHTVRQKIIIQ